MTVPLVRMERRKQRDLRRDAHVWVVAALIWIASAAAASVSPASVRFRVGWSFICAAMILRLLYKAAVRSWEAAEIEDHINEINRLIPVR